VSGLAQCDDLAAVGVDDDDLRGLRRAIHAGDERPHKSSLDIRDCEWCPAQTHQEIEDQPSESA
jgi:hypothetical protein